MTDEMNNIHSGKYDGELIDNDLLHSGDKISNILLDDILMVRSEGKQILRVNTPIQVICGDSLNRDQKTTSDMRKFSEFPN